jgi:formate hydrogenlyase subunit 6/NADH:ubiquinone oxidoreductase subunit I
MNALSLLLENLARGAVTVRFPARPPAPAAFRGLVDFDEERCQGCGMCAFVCTSGSIVYRPRPKTYEWSYEPGACTFCGRCVDACVSHAISMQPSRPPVYTRAGELHRAFSVPRRPPPGTPPPPPTAAKGTP